MAGEITVQILDNRDNGSVDWSLFYYFDISASPIVDNDGVKVSTQSASNLPAYASGKLSQAQKDAIDAGDAAFMQRTVQQTPGELQSAFIVRVEADYAALKAYWVAEEQSKYSKRGLQRNIP